MKDWKKELDDLLEDYWGYPDGGTEKGFIRGEMGIFELVQQELSKAREEGIKSGVENAWGMINSILDTLDVNKNEEEISILVGILKILDTEITKLSKLTTK